MDPSYNNLGGFGSGGAVPPVQTSAPISSGTGDIILAPEKKSHKGVIVALILAVLVIGGLFAAMFLIPKGGGNGGVSNDAKVAFYKYANYLLYGEDSDKALEGAYDESSIYKIDEIRSENAQIATNYFKTAAELLTSFETSINSSSNDDFSNTLSTYRTDFELVRHTFNKEFVSEEGLVNEVLKNELEDVKAWVVSKYASLSKLDYEVVKKYAELEINYYQLYAEYLDKAKRTGCLNAEGDLVCEDFNDEELEIQMEEISDEADSLLQNARYYVLKGCWDINKFLNGEVRDEE